MRFINWSALREVGLGTALALGLFILAVPVGGLDRQNVVADSTAVVVDTSAVIGALRHPDAGTLALWSEAAGVPPAYTYAVAWQETRNNPDPLRRGAQGEWGRFQIMPATAAARCKGLDIRTYYDNLACFLRMTVEDYDRCGEWSCVASIHNTGRPGSRGYANYVDSVMTTVRQIVRARVEA